MPTLTQPTENRPLGDEPMLLPFKDIEGMEPYTTFLKRIPQVIFHIPEDPPITVVQECDTPFTSWKMAQSIVSVLYNYPTSLEIKKEGNWIRKHFQLGKELIPDPDHIVLPSDGSALCYSNEKDADFVPVKRLDAFRKTCYIAHDDAFHNLEKKLTFTVVGPNDYQRECSIITEIPRHCPKCKDKIKNVLGIPLSEWNSYNEQKQRILKSSLDNGGDDGNGKAVEEDLHNRNNALDDWSALWTWLPHRTSQEFITSDMLSEATPSDMSRDEDGYFDMAPPEVLDDDDDEPDSPAMLEFGHVGNVRRNSGPPSDG